MWKTVQREAWRILSGGLTVAIGLSLTLAAATVAQSLILRSPVRGGIVGDAEALTQDESNFLTAIYNAVVGGGSTARMEQLETDLTALQADVTAMSSTLSGTGGITETLANIEATLASPPSGTGSASIGTSTNTGTVRYSSNNEYGFTSAVQTAVLNHLRSGNLAYMVCQSGTSHTLGIIQHQGNGTIIYGNSGFDSWYTACSATQSGWNERCYIYRGSAATCSNGWAVMW